MLRVVVIGVLGATLAFSAGAELEAALARMDRVAATLKDLSADLKRTHRIAVINEDTEDLGQIFIKRPKPHELLMRVDIKLPDPKQMALDTHRVEIYYPKSKTEEVYELGKYKKLADQLLLLGFGSTSKDLAAGYTVALGGEETLNTQKTTRLELTPKSDEMHLRRVDLWISDSTGLPLQQKLLWPGGDYDLATYTNMKINPNQPDTAFKIAIPPGTKRVFPQR